MPSSLDDAAHVDASVRIFVILARNARRAVVFRRGPTKEVLLLTWDTVTDVIVEGQWLRGRIYERRSDLSPSGDKLVYFVGKFRGPHQTWTAVSRPPWLTALAMWPSSDTWGGGGLFESDSKLLLNFGNVGPYLSSGERLPSDFAVEPLAIGGVGADTTLHEARLRRDGWRCTVESRWKQVDFDAPIRFLHDPPLTYRRARPGKKSDGLELQMRILGYGQPNGPWDVVEFDLVETKRTRETVTPLGRLDWADWDVNGDLLFAHEGRLYRRSMAQPEAREIADLRGLTFRRRRAPREATQWKGRLPSKSKT